MLGRWKDAKDLENTPSNIAPANGDNALKFGNLQKQLVNC